MEGGASPKPHRNRGAVLLEFRVRLIILSNLTSNITKCRVDDGGDHFAVGFPVLWR